LGVEIVKKNVFSKGPASSPDIHPKISPKPDFRDQGVSNRVTNAGKKKVFSGRPACMVLLDTYSYVLQYNNNKLDRRNAAEKT